MSINEIPIRNGGDDDDDDEENDDDGEEEEESSFTNVLKRRATPLKAGPKSFLSVKFP
jgi:hypothetical protein